MSNRAIIYPTWGPQAFQKAVLRPGERLLIGSAETMGFQILHDQHLGAALVEVSWEGCEGRVRAVNPGQTVIVNGKPVSEGPLGHLTWFRVGETTFLCCRERYTPPDPVPVPQRASQSAWAIEMMRNVGDSLFAVLDAARDDRILQLLRESPNEVRSLYEGSKGDAMADAAPYLVRLGPQDWLLESLVTEGWGQSWGVYFDCALSFKEVRRHLRHFLRVQQEGAQEFIYFRFYDPRVLRIFLPTCIAAQLDQFYGPIQRFLFEDPSGELRQVAHQSKRANNNVRTEDEATSDL